MELAVRKRRRDGKRSRLVFYGAIVYGAIAVAVATLSQSTAQASTPTRLEAVATSVALHNRDVITVGVVYSTVGHKLRQAFGLAEYKPDGELNPAFGIGGEVTTYFGSHSEAGAGAVAVDRSGRIVVAGNNGHAFDSFSLARYLPSGRLDRTFGHRGKVAKTPGIDGDYALANAIAIEPSGRIIVAGSSGYSTNSIALAAYRPNGNLDPTFGNGGTVKMSLGTDSEASGVAIDSQGRLVIAGSVYQFRAVGINSFLVARLLSDGQLDSTFGTDGIVATPEQGQASAVSFDSAGRIVAAGASFSTATTDHQFALARYDQDGSPDSSFGSGGVVTGPFASPFTTAPDLAIGSDGRMTAVGSTGASGTATTFAVARYLPDGSLDPAFGNDGAVTTDVDPQGPDVARAEALTPDGRIVAAGYTSPEELSRNVALAQYLPNGALDPEFANSGTQITTFLPTTGITNASIKSADRRAKFRFDAIGPVRGFECSLVRGAPTRPHFSSCGSPQAYKDLKRGHYTFEVRALFAGGGPDPNPASLRFSIR